MNTKWIEANIDLTNKPRKKYLLDIYDKIVANVKDKILSWHFLWEGKPYPTTLRLRFHGSSEIIDREVKPLVESKLKEMKVEYCFGKHGKYGEQYEGEEDTYGERGWYYLEKILHLGSDFAIELMKTKKNSDFKWSTLGYAERWIHLFLNQLSTELEQAGFTEAHYLIALGSSKAFYALISRINLTNNILFQINLNIQKLVEKQTKLNCTK